MVKRLIAYGVAGFLFLNVTGCLAILAGTAAGAGTAVWLSGKMTQQMDASYERTVSAAESAVQSLGLAVDKVTREAEVTQLRSTYSDGKEVWIDVRKLTDVATKVEVRVGAVNPDKKAASSILKRIQELI